MICEQTDLFIDQLFKQINLRKERLQTVEPAGSMSEKPLQIGKKEIKPDPFREEKCQAATPSTANAGQRIIGKDPVP
ncbi:MAG: hypothetical protein HQM03_18550 [Magnetococcales bacterium]|nr:hypothetical protein [Magnetococcales bacterium]